MAQRMRSFWSGRGLSRFFVICGVLVLLSAPAASQVVEYVHLDALGNVRAVTDQNGVVIERHDYLPFGEECTTGPCASNPNAGAGQPRKFTGKERDTETGFDYFGARYYQAKWGRFTTVDPVYTWKDNLVNPQLWNRYAYARNNPLRFVDPDGRCSAPAGLSGGAVGFCVESFIAASSIGGIGLGDNRGFDAHDATLTARAQIRFVVDAATGKISNESAVPGVSKVGIPPLGIGAGPRGGVDHSISDVTRGDDGSTSFTLAYKAVNGFGEGLFNSIDVNLKLRVDANGQTSIQPGSLRDAYPSLGVYSYRNIGGTDVASYLYEGRESTSRALAGPMIPVPPTEKRP